MSKVTCNTVQMTFDSDKMKASHKPYQYQMLPDINYDKLKIEDLMSLEKDVYDDLSIFVEKLGARLEAERLPATVKIILEGMSAYFGFFTIEGLGKVKAKELQADINKLINRATIDACDMFSTHPVTGTEVNRFRNFSALMILTPGKIMSHAMSITRAMSAIIKRLFSNHELYQRSKTCRCNLVPLVKALAEQSFITPEYSCNTGSMSTSNSSFQKQGHELYFANQMLLQMAWVAGHSAHLGTLDGKSTATELMNLHAHTITSTFENCLKYGEYSEAMNNDYSGNITVH